MYEIKTEDILKAQNSDDEAMTNIIEQNSGLLWSIVKRFLGRGYEKEELYQIACIGFIKAIKRFDVSLNLRMSTYAVPYIMGEIKRFIRDDRAGKNKQKYKRISRKNKISTERLFVQKRRRAKHIGDSKNIKSIKRRCSDGTRIRNAIRINR